MIFWTKFSSYVLIELNS